MDRTSVFFGREPDAPTSTLLFKIDSVMPATATLISVTFFAPTGKNRWPQRCQSHLPSADIARGSSFEMGEKDHGLTIEVSSLKWRRLYIAREWMSVEGASRATLALGSFEG